MVMIGPAMALRVDDGVDGTLGTLEAWGARGALASLGRGSPLEQLINLQRGVWSSASCQGRGSLGSLSGIRDLNQHLCLF